MAAEPKHIDVEELIADPSAVMDRVTENNEEIVVDRNGEGIVVLKPIRRAAVRRRGKSRAGIEAALSAAGGWKGLVDADALKEELYSSRGSDRPSYTL